MTLRHHVAVVANPPFTALSLSCPADQLASVTEQHSVLKEEQARTSSALVKLEADHCVAESNRDRLDKDLTALRQVGGHGRGANRGLCVGGAMFTTRCLGTAQHKCPLV